MYYVYKTTNIANNKIYVGVHKSDNIQNDNYLGSGKYLNEAIKKYGKQNFKRQILFQCKTQKQMYQKQAQIVNQQFLKRQDTYNLTPGGYGGLAGMVVVKDKDGNVLKVPKDDPRYLSGQLVSVNEGIVTVKDKDGKCFEVSKDDPRYLSGQLVGVNKGIKMPKNHQKGSKNSQYGTMWITNGIQNKKIKKEDPIPQNWIRGRSFIK